MAAVQSTIQIHLNLTELNIGDWALYEAQRQSFHSESNLRCHLALLNHAQSQTASFVTDGGKEWKGLRITSSLWCEMCLVFSDVCSCVHNSWIVRLRYFLDIPCLKPGLLFQIQIPHAWREPELVIFQKCKIFCYWLWFNGSVLWIHAIQLIFSYFNCTLKSCQCGLYFAWTPMTSACGCILTLIILSVRSYWSQTIWPHCPLLAKTDIREYVAGLYHT